jgi:hypothetical protein
MNDKDNPYLASSVAAAASLSPADRRALEIYWRWREQAPTFSAIIRSFLTTWLRTLLISTLVAAGALFALGYDDGSYMVAWILGMLMGMVTRDVGYGLRMVSRWPLQQRIIDWDKVAKLLGDRLT